MSFPRSIPLPPNLAPVAEDVELYVEQRIKQFAELYSRKLGVSSYQSIESSTLEVIEAARQLNVANNAPQFSPRPSRTSSQVKMTFKHVCRSSGCGETDCLLCKYNPDRRCSRHIKFKYLVEDRFRARCNAPIFIEFASDNGEISDMSCFIQLQLLDGQKYDELAKTTTGQPNLSDVVTCLIPNPKGLKWAKGIDTKQQVNEEETKLSVPVEGGKVSLDEVQVMLSSEAILTGYRPNFRLLAVAMDTAGQRLPNVPYAVSDAFVVTTRRVKNCVKVDIPLINDDISKLIHMGRATVEKMQNLPDAAKALGIQLMLPPDLHRINTVGKFQSLVDLCEKERSLKSKVMQLLKLNNDKWEEATQHAHQAVMPDFRPRIWVHRGHNVGIVFKCRHGAVQLDQPEGLVELQSDGCYDPSQIIPIGEVHNPQTLAITQQLRLEAANAWTDHRHPGWGICPRPEDEPLEHVREDGGGVSHDGGHRPPSPQGQENGMVVYHGHWPNSHMQDDVGPSHTVTSNGNVSSPTARPHRATITTSAAPQLPSIEPPRRFHGSSRNASILSRATSGPWVDPSAPLSPFINHPVATPAPSGSHQDSDSHGHSHGHPHAHPSSNGGGGSAGGSAAGAAGGDSRKRQMRSLAMEQASERELALHDQQFRASLERERAERERGEATPTQPATTTIATLVSLPSDLRLEGGTRLPSLGSLMRGTTATYPSGEIQVPLEPSLTPLLSGMPVLLMPSTSLLSQHVVQLQQHPFEYTTIDESGRSVAMPAYAFKNVDLNTGAIEMATAGGDGEAQGLGLGPGAAYMTRFSFPAAATRVGAKTPPGGQQAQGD